MSRVLAPALTLLLLGCRPAAPVAAAPPAPVAAIPLGEPALDGLAIVAVPQWLLPDPDRWRFEPGGSRIAAAPDFGDVDGHGAGDGDGDGDGDGACGLWDIPSGAYIGPWTGPKPSPCATWAEPAWLFDGSDGPSSDGTLAYAIDDARVVVLRVPGERLRTLSCDRCAAVAGVDWAPGEHRLVIAREDGRVELWDADAGALERSFALPLAAGSSLDDLDVQWGPAGIFLHVISTRRERCTVYVDDDGYPSDASDCEPEDEGTGEVPGWETVYDRRVEVWTGEGQPAYELDLSNFARDRRIGEVFTDPRQRWLFAISDSDDPRASGERALEVLAFGEDSGLQWDEPDPNAPDDPLEIERSGIWRADAGTSWLETFTRVDAYAWSWAYGWRATRVEPEPARFEEVVTGDDGDALDGELVPWGFHDGRAAIEGTICVDATDGESCDTRTIPLVPRDCTLADLSPTLTQALVECRGGLELRGGSQTAARRLPFTAQARWIWTRGGALALRDGEGTLQVIAAEAGPPLLERRQVTRMLDAKLAATRDRLVLVIDGAVEIVDLAQTPAAVLLRLPEQDATAAALSPDGASLALLVDDEVRLFALADGDREHDRDREHPQPQARWHDGDATELGFRQDGAALFTGRHGPQRVWTLGGEALPLPAGLDADGEIDPSWRWIATGDDRFIRTLDGLALQLHAGGAYLDDGRFDGEPAADLADWRFRLGEVADAPPQLRLADLEPWLRRPGLVAAFFAGQAIAPARVPEAEAARLQTRAATVEP